MEFLSFKGTLFGNVHGITSHRLVMTVCRTFYSKAYSIEPHCVNYFSGARRVSEHAESLLKLDLIWFSLPAENSLHPEPSLISFLGLPFFSAHGALGGWWWWCSNRRRVQGVEIVEVLSSFYQVQVNNLMIGTLFEGKWKSSKTFSVYGECSTCCVW